MTLPVVTRRRCRWPSRAAAALLVGLAAAGGAVPATHAAVADLPLPLTLLFCTGTTTVTYDPPLTNMPTTTTVAFRTDLPSCPTSLLGTVESGGGEGQFVQPEMSCNTLALPPDTTQLYLWDTEEASEVTWTDNTVTRGSANTVAAWHGSVTSGLYDGTDAVSETTMLNTDIDACSTTGVSQLSGQNTLTLVGTLP